MLAGGGMTTTLGVPAGGLCTVDVGSFTSITHMMPTTMMMMTAVTTIPPRGARLALFIVMEQSFPWRKGTRLETVGSGAPRLRRRSYGISHGLGKR